MGRCIAITNQKGGVGKTTTAINLAACLADRGKTVLAVDMDPQGNMSSGLGLEKNQLNQTIYDVLLGDAAVADVVQSTDFPHLFVLPANRNLAGAEIELISFEKREYVLKTALAELKAAYDFIVIDCPPALNILTINAMTAADTVLVPIQCEYFALEGLEQLLHTVGLVRKSSNPQLVLEGVVFTMYDARTNLSAQVVEEVKASLTGKEVYQCIVPRSVRLGEAPSHGLPIIAYDPKSKGADAYRILAEAAIQRKVKA